MSEAKTARPGRDGKTTLVAWVNKEGAFAFQELLLKLGRDRGERITAQEAVTQALNEFGRKHGIELNLS